MQRRSWRLLGLGAAGVLLVGALLWLSQLVANDEDQQARDLLNELESTDSVLNAPPPQDAVELRRLVLDDCWNTASGPSEPLVLREYDYEGDPAEFREYFTELLGEGGWTEVPHNGAAELLAYRRDFGELTARMRLTQYSESTYHLMAGVDHQFCEDEN